MTQVISSTSVLASQFASVRKQTEHLCAPLSAEDMMVQSCAEASPVKWHLAHTTWFFEVFILKEFLAGYQEFNADFVWLFNSYYKSLGKHPEKKLRASFSRPALTTILDYRCHVEDAMQRLIESGIPREAEERLILGLHHEQQHQELIATDIKHALWTNPLHPAYQSAPSTGESQPTQPSDWIEQASGLCEIGYAGDDFSFDNERPRHKQYLRPYSLASRLVTCAEYLEF